MKAERGSNSEDVHGRAAVCMWDDPPLYGAVDRPCRAIDASVLVAYGEVMTLLGGLVGIDYIYAIVVHEV